MTDKQEAAAKWLNRAYILSRKIDALKQEKKSLESDIRGMDDNK